MTAILPKKNILDKLLTLLGKERLPNMKGVGDIYQRLGKYAIIRISYESFFKALFRKNK